MDSLATLAQVKEWLNISATTTDADGLLTRLVASASQFVLNYLTIPSFARTVYEETYDGYGKDFMFLRQSPVLTINGLWFGGQAIPAATGDGKTARFASGYRVSGQRLSLFGQYFPSNRGSVIVNYSAGYETTETLTVASATVTPSQTPLGVTSISLGATPLTKVASAPAAMQYSFNAGVFVFNAAQNAAVLTVVYSYAPADITQAVVELVGERFKRKDRIGYSSKTLGGQETVAFTADDVSKNIMKVFNKYRNVIPV